MKTARSVSYFLMISFLLAIFTTCDSNTDASNKENLNKSLMFTAGMVGGVSEKISSIASVYNYNSGNISSATTATIPIDLYVTPPADGYIIVNAGGTFTIAQTSTANNRITFWLDKMVGATRESSSPDRSVRLDTTGSQAATISTPVYIKHVFPVTGGVECNISLRAIRDSTGTNTASFSQQSSMQIEFVTNKLPCRFSVCGSSCYGTCSD